MDDGWTLDGRLAADTRPVGDLALCAVRLMDDRRVPWLVLVPRRPDLAEITDLADDDYARLADETRLATRVMLALAGPDKVNVGALGNVVRQLHVHVVGRFVSDAAWPGPIWGSGPPQRYPDHAAAALIDRAAQLFATL